MNLKLTYFFLCITGCLSFLPIRASERNFSTFTVGGNIRESVIKNTFHDYWSFDKGVELYLKTPFYLCNLTFGTDYYSFKKKTSEVTDFYSMHFFIGAELEYEVFHDLYVSGGVKTGNNRIVFDDDKVQEAIKSETELFLGTYCALRYNIYKDLFLDIRSEYKITFTKKRIEETYIGAGLSYQFDTPKIIQEFLK